MPACGEVKDADMVNDMSARLRWFEETLERLRYAPAVACDMAEALSSASLGHGGGQVATLRDRAAKFIQRVHLLVVESQAYEDDLHEACAAVRDLLAEYVECTKG